MVQSFCKWSSALCVDLLHYLLNILDESWTSVKLGALDTARPISLGIHFVLHATKFKCVGKPPVKRFSSGQFMQTMTRFCWMLENTLEGKSGDRLPRKLFERSLSNLETHFGKIEFSNFISLTLRFTSSDFLPMNHKLWLLEIQMAIDNASVENLRADRANEHLY